MTKLILLSIYIVLFSTSAYPQEPVFSWGKSIPREAGKLGRMEIVGVDEDGFFTTYRENNQTSLEHYNPDADDFWTTALHPTTTDGQPATLHSVQMIAGSLYMISSDVADGQTSVYAQEVSHQGDYMKPVKLIAQSKYSQSLYVATNPRKTNLMLALTGDKEQPTTVALLNADLENIWNHTLPLNGVVQEVLVRPRGTAYLLTRSSAAAPATTAFYLYKLNAAEKDMEEAVIGDTNYRPLRARLCITPSREVVVAGYMIPASSVASHKPEPVGTFYYRFGVGNLEAPAVSYVPFNTKFIHNYKRYKPDNDQSQRLRNLRLDRIVPLSDNGVLLIGEVAFTEALAGSRVSHTNDILVIRLRNDGKAVFAKSINKLQNNYNSSDKLLSYFATTVGDTLKIIYLDYKYKREPANRPTHALSTVPMLVTVAPNGAVKTKQLTKYGNNPDANFFICPRTFYPKASDEFILIGIAPTYYKYGRMTI